MGCEFVYAAPVLLKLSEDRLKGTPELRESCVLPVSLTKRSREGKPVNDPRQTLCCTEGEEWEGGDRGVDGGRGEMDEREGLRYDG